MGSALPDQSKPQAALAPIPQQAIENKPAPGQTGPKGMSPRTTYSRVNTGVPPIMDAGAMGQKSSPNRGMEFLPAKIAAQRGFTMTTMHERPSLQSMVKAAMAGTTQQLSVNLEASRQASTRGGATKTASAPVDLDKHVPTELAHKLAGALGYIEQQLRKEAELMPGEGPGALTVLEAGASGGPILSGGDSGQATAQNQPPRTPALQAEEVQSGNAGTGLETNDDMSHPEQPIEPIKNASGLAASNMQRLRKMAGIADVAKGAVGKVKGVANKINKSPTLMRASEFVKEHKTPLAAGAGALVGAGAGAALGSRKKEGSAPIALLRKLAEDAINPAHIESAKGQGDSPEGASASGEGVPSGPSDVSSQKSM